MTMNGVRVNRSVRRHLLAWLVLCAWVTGCMNPAVSDGGQDRDQQRRFLGIGLILVVDAVPSAEMKGVVFYNDKGTRVYSSSVVAKRNRSIMALSSARVPLTLRAVWREPSKPVWGQHGGIDYEGPIIGDYTIPVAERIPDEVLRDIRARGGALRLKFRLKPDGVLFGWDIERPGGGISRFDMPGGDFLETRY